jgi:hypothetical protein
VAVSRFLVASVGVSRSKIVVIPLHRRTPLHNSAFYIEICVAQFGKPRNDESSIRNEIDLRKDGK